MTGWNWKAALLSSMLRGTLFFFTNLWAGFDRAVFATLAELVFRGATAGFYGNIIQAVRNVQSAWVASAVSFVLIPVVSHSLEYLVHRNVGTPFLKVSIALSVVLTILSNSFHLFAMRRGAFLTGKDGHSLIEDLRQVPPLLRQFVMSGVRGAFPHPPRQPAGCRGTFSRREKARPEDSPLPPGEGGATASGLTRRVRVGGPKTLHITNFYHSASGGVGTYYRALIDAANRERRMIRLVVPGDSARVEEIGRYGRIYHVKAPRAPFFDRRYRLLLPHTYACPYESELRRILRHEQPDLVEVCDKYALSWLPTVLRKNWIRGVERPVLVGMSAERMDDNLSAFVGTSNLGQRFSRWYMRHAYVPRFDWHIANSNYTAEELLNAGVPRFKERVFVCAPGVDVDAFAAGEPSAVIRNYLTSVFRDGDKAKLLVYGGRLSPEKNLPLLFDILEALPDTEHQQFRLIIAGAGPLENRLVEEAKRRLPGRVAFMGHIRSRRELASLYANCDAFVHPNPREPFGIALLEAMAAGLAVVAPGRGGVLSYLNAGNAWLSEPDGNSFAAVVQDLFSNPQLRARRVAQARKTADEYRWEQVAPRLFALYDRFVFHDSGRKDDTTERTFHMERASGCPQV